MTEHCVLMGLLICALSGIPGLFLDRRRNHGQHVSAVLTGLGCGIGLIGLLAGWIGAETVPENAVSFSLPLPALSSSNITFRVDGLSALFLLPIFLISLLGSIYGLGYWKQSENIENGVKLRLFYGLLTAGMALVVIAQDSIIFLIGWEIMAIAAYFLVTTEDQNQEVRESGWIYLVATHVATLCLFALFGVLRSVNGSFALVPIEKSDLSSGLMLAIFFLALCGFGVKAGIMPLHVWLPSAHALAPSHVSAIMSGVIIKMGIYGLVRIFSLIPHPPIEWGWIVLGLGAISGILGVAFAIGQHDLKRLLAYHSIENIGIIVMGLGLALLGKSLDQTEWIILGLSGALLHVMNHALFKALLFLSAGSVIHAAHTREIDHLGGLQKIMPWTAFCFLIGAVAICGLPPLNGFVSEFLIYLGLFRSQLSTLGFQSTSPKYVLSIVMFAIPALALIGTLAVACFVKVYGAVFLGSKRSIHIVMHESPSSMLKPMYVLVIACFFIGLAPVLVSPVLDQAVSAWTSGQKIALKRLTLIAPIGWISILGLALFLAFVVAYYFLSSSLIKQAASRKEKELGTWACGYVAPTPRMQYTSSSFAQMLVWLFAWALRPQIKKTSNADLFPQQTSFHSEVSDTVLDDVVLPTFRLSARLVNWFRLLQQGSVQTYLVYILLILIILLLWH